MTHRRFPSVAPTEFQLVGNLKLFQPGLFQPGLFQPGLFQPGLFQPGCNHD